MSVIIQYLGATADSKTLARLSHGKHEFTAWVDGNPSDLNLLCGEDCMVEMSFDRVLSWNQPAEFDDSDSCIRAADSPPGAITLLGRVHSVIKAGEISCLIDLYVQTGPEFLSIESTELGGCVPEIGSALEVTVQGLCFYLTNT